MTVSVPTEAILRLYFADRERAGGLGHLLFPSPVLRSEALIVDFRKTLDAVAMRAGWERGEIRSKMFRHRESSCGPHLAVMEGGGGRADLALTLPGCGS